MNGNDYIILEIYRIFIYALHFVLGVAILVFLIISWYYVVYFVLAFKKPKVLEQGKTLYRYAVLIPARNESRVIKNLLDSLNNQDYDKEHFEVFVIVEDKNDPTIYIVKKYGKRFHIVLRKDTTNRKTKGFALDDCYHYIKENNMDFDAFMVFDADNILNKDYISKMNDVKNLGYKVGSGYRNFTNASVNWVSGCSAMLFSFMNNITSSGRSFLFKKCTLTGTGYYVDKDIIDNEGGWVFNGMTEDVELTTYCYYHNISMYYYRLAMYYDEQSNMMSIVHKQHIRWVWGYLANKKRFKKKELDYKSSTKKNKRIALWEYNVGIFPFGVLLILEVLAFLIGFGLFISSIIFSTIPQYASYFANNNIVAIMFWNLFLAFLYLYITFSFISIVVFVVDNKNLKFSKIKIFITTFTFLFYFADFILAFFDGLIHKKKRVTWDKIEHLGNIVDKEASRAKNEKD